MKSPEKEIGWNQVVMYMCIRLRRSTLPSEKSSESFNYIWLSIWSLNFRKLTLVTIEGRPNVAWSKVEYDYCSLEEKCSNGRSDSAESNPNWEIWGRPVNRNQRTLINWDKWWEREGKQGRRQNIHLFKVSIECYYILGTVLGIGTKGNVQSQKYFFTIKEFYIEWRIRY